MRIAPLLVPSRRATGLVVIVCSLVLAASTASPPPPSATSEPEEEGPTLRVHKDPAALEQAVLDGTLAFLREDPVKARAALDRMEEACNRLKREEGSPFPGNVIVYDQAFHSALDVAREYAGKGRLDASFDQLSWLQRGCRICHGMVAEAAAAPPPGQP